MAQPGMGNQNLNGSSSQGFRGLVRLAARWWVRTQFHVISAVSVSAILVALGFQSQENSPFATLGQAFAHNSQGVIALAVALFVVSILAFILSRLPGSRDSMSAFAGDAQRPAPPAMPYGPMSQPLQAPWPAPMSQPLQPPMPGPMSQPLRPPMPASPSMPLPGPMPGPMQPPMPGPMSQPLQPWQAPPSMPLAAPAPRRGPNRLILFGVLALFLITVGLVAAGVGLVANSTNALRQEPIAVVQGYCDALMKHTTDGYKEAYQALSAKYQTQLEQAPFMQLSDLSDKVDGAAQTCVPVPEETQVDVGAGGATVAINMRRTNVDHPLSGNIQLSRDRKTWRIDKLDDALLGTHVEPLAVAVNFCEALVRRDFGTAYEQVSKGYKDNHGTVDHFIRTLVEIESPGSPNDVGFEKCTTNYASYKVASSSQATVLIIWTIATYNSKGQIVSHSDFTNEFTMIVEDGRWVVRYIQAPPSQ